MHPKYHGYSAIKVADLTAVEFRSRDDLRRGLAWWRQHMPGWEHAYLLETADQIGVRHSRRLVGEVQITLEQWRRSGRHADSIGLCPGVSEAFPTLEIPYRSLVPRELEGLLVAGRNLSCDVRSHNPLREVPECWVMGQGAGVGAALAAHHGVAARAVPVAELQAELRRQGALVTSPERAALTTASAGAGSAARSA